ncbi:GUN4 domain-containing protein [Mastigocoleus sp. MO_188.B34]|uniref:GUN4 domain-containing protein n=1 Tax=Mastigocoleus sp. MO_188.B34 TaxID=3036635 RepID=UPI002612A0F9|nr:GUN4 domain-containing protein [Mastigocoleus sp. MO_188.B34]MDJ0698070.1 GUN4 domain-containing protein [Mastigocoleus sp. MO_188.B34]
MDLSAKQREQLQGALIDAFPNKVSLEQMLSFNTNKKLDVIAGGDNLQEIVFNLIKKAEAENWVKYLIDAAHKSNPENSHLKTIAIFYINNEISLEESKLPKNIPTTGFKASEVGVDYTKLAQLLGTKNFKAANDETVEKMLWVSGREKEGYLRAQDIENFPEKDLLTIDKLWLASSGDKFGFSVQKQIWIELCDKLGRTDWKTYLQFIERVGWKVKDSIFENLRWELRAVEGHLPIAIASTHLDVLKKEFPQVDQSVEGEFYRDLSRLFDDGNHRDPTDMMEGKLSILKYILGEFCGSDLKFAQYETSVSRLFLTMYPKSILERLMNDDERQVSQRIGKPEEQKQKRKVAEEILEKEELAQLSSSYKKLAKEMEWNEMGGMANTLGMLMVALEILKLRRD